MSGILVRPWKEFKKTGFLGIIKGIWQGLTGVVIKPVVGTYDLIITISEGLINHSKYEESIMEVRSRPIRIFGDNSIIIPFDYVPSVCKEIIRKYKIKTYDHESFLYYEEIEVSKSNISLLIVTDIRILYAKKRSSIDYKKLKLCKVKSVTYKQRNNKLYFTTDVPISNNCCTTKKFELELKYSS